MKIICAGLPKTGTTSLAAALKILGFTVHDYEEHMEFHMDEYIQAYKGKMPDFATMYKNVDATTDFPSCFFWENIKESFPDAKVILMERDNVESWVKSVQNLHAVRNSIISSTLWMRIGLLMTPSGRKWKGLEANFHDLLTPTEQDTPEERLSRLYTDHNARVKTAIPRDELLLYNLKQGWKPLCEFLGVEVPDVPFPRLNVNNQDIPVMMMTRSVAMQRIYNELVLILTILVIAIAILIFMMIN